MDPGQSAEGEGGHWAVPTTMTYTKRGVLALALEGARSIAARGGVQLVSCGAALDPIEREPKMQVDEKKKAQVPMKCHVCPTPETPETPDFHFEVTCMYLLWNRT
jgi:hypothetical protein